MLKLSFLDLIQPIFFFFWIPCEFLREHYCYIGHLSRCYIMNQRAWQAWELYLKMETCSDSMNLLVAIANDCYKVKTKNYSLYYLKLFFFFQHLIKIGISLFQNFFKIIGTLGGRVRLPIISVGQNRTTPFLKTGSLADTLFLTKILFLKFWKNCFLEKNSKKNIFFQKN